MLGSCIPYISRSFLSMPLASEFTPSSPQQLSLHFKKIPIRPSQQAKGVAASAEELLFRTTGRVDGEWTTYPLLGCGLNFGEGEEMEFWRTTERWLL